jgi:hypothetical protein
MINGFKALSGKGARGRLVSAVFALALFTLLALILGLSLGLKPTLAAPGGKTLHIRQAVENSKDTLGVPQEGYARLSAGGKEYGASFPGGKTGAPAAYQAYTLPDNGSAYTIQAVVPAWYKLNGYKVSNTEAGNDSAGLIGVFPTITDLFGAETEIWVTVTLQPINAGQFYETPYSLAGGELPLQVPHIPFPAVFYSEGNVTLGNGTAEAPLETDDEHMTIKLTSPVGAATVRYFTTAVTVPEGEWVFDKKTTNATLEPVTAGRVYKVSFPANTTGTATLTVGGEYIIDFVLTDKIPASDAVKVGETFEASGIEWRVLHKNSASDVLVIAEHVLDKQIIHETPAPLEYLNDWDTNIRWAGSELRTKLHDSTYSYSYGRLDSAFQAMILDTTLHTRKGWNDARYAGYDDLPGQKLFLLSEEEVFHTIVNGAATTNGNMDLNQSVHGSVTLFADYYARRATGLTGTERYWLRSPRDDITTGATTGAAFVNMSTGVVGSRSVNDSSTGSGGSNLGVRPALRLNLGVTVTGFSLSASGAGSQDFTNATTNQSITLLKRRSQQLITLTGSVTGRFLPDNPALTSWTPSGANAGGWAAAGSTNAQTYTVTIPAGETGTVVMSAKPKDDPSGTPITVTIEVVDCTLFYSEGNVALGDGISGGLEDADDENITINLTSPVGAETIRYFTTKNKAGTANITVPEGLWVLDSTGLTGGPATLVAATANQEYGVRFPAGASGTAKLTVGEYTVTFKVTANVPATNAVKVGETFKASDIEWRVLHKNGASDVLVIAEHVFDKQLIHSTLPVDNWDTTIRWAGSELRTKLHNSTFSYSYDRLNSGFREMILDTTLHTRKGWSDVRFDGYDDLPGQKLFLLSEEEVFRTIANTAGTTDAHSMELSKNVHGDVVLFADYHARKATGLTGAERYWLRSPRGSANNATTGAAFVNMSSGAGGSRSVNDAASNLGVRPALRLNLGAAVTRFSVSSSGAGSQDFTDATANRSITLVKRSTQQLITLTGSVTGRFLPDNPALTNWSRTGEAWGAAAHEAQTYTVTIPAGATGTMVVSAKPKDDPSGTPITVTLEVVEYTLFYSEGNVTLGDGINGGLEDADDENITISLTSPVGAETIRYFTTRNKAGSANLAVPEELWVLDAGGTGATRVQVSPDQVYGIRFPAGASGAATLTVGEHTVTFNVAANVPASDAVKVGETFEESGIEWRVLHKNSASDVLVIAEHVLDSQPIHNSTPTDWDTNVRWAGSQLRTKLNDSSYSYSYGRLNPLFQALILDTTLHTRRGWRDARFDGYDTLPNQKLFLLSEEEVFQTIVNGASTTNAKMDLSQSVHGSAVLFADGNARTATGVSTDYYWLRSPRSYEYFAARVNISPGVMGNVGSDYIDKSFGVRPALRLNLAPTVLDFSVSADGIGPQGSAIQYFANATANRTISLIKSDSQQAITLTGNVDGRFLLDDPALTSWTPSGAKAGDWAAAGSTDAQTYTVIIPAGETGSMVVSAKPKDDPSGTPITVTIEVVNFTLFYSEGNVRLGDGTADELENADDLSMTIYLTSPAGAATTRYFTTKNEDGTANFTTAPGSWVLTDTDNAQDASLTQVTANRAYGVTFPIGFEGNATLTVGGKYTVNFVVTANVPANEDVRVGETFVGSGIEWRVLHKNGAADVLVIAEHILDVAKRVHGTSPDPSTVTDWDTAIRWDGSALRPELNGSAYDYSYERLASDFRSLILGTTLYTRIGSTDSRTAPYLTNGYDGYYRLEDQKVFLLSEEELFRTIANNTSIAPYGPTTNANMDLKKNVHGDVVLFADNNARKASYPAGLGATTYYLRSPRTQPTYIALAISATGEVSQGIPYVITTYGLRPALRLNLTPAVLDFSVSAAGIGPQSFTRQTTNQTITLVKSEFQQRIDLTGHVAGNFLPDDPALTTWSKSGANTAWGADPGDGTTYAVIIPPNVTGTIVVTARAKDDPNKTLNVTINVVDFTLYYSEGKVTLGDGNVTELEDTNTTMTIKLTSPVGAATTRYFTSRNMTDTGQQAIPLGIWDLDANGTGATLVPVTDNQVYGVRFPAGAQGTATLTVGGKYTITFEVTPDVPASDNVRAGETFEASDIEWRVLYKTSASDVLVIAEHVLEQKPLHGSAPTDWDVNIGWGGSDLRAYLNGTWYNALDANFQDMILLTALHTKRTYADFGYNDTNDKVFLLSEEEVLGQSGYYNGTTQTADLTKNAVPGVALFPSRDIHATKASGISGVNASLYWLRSPRNGATAYPLEPVGGAAIVSMGAGNVAVNAVNQSSVGVRPALRLNLGPQVTGFSVSATGAASGSANAGGTIDITLNASTVARSVDLTGVVAGTFLSNNPGQTIFTPSGAVNLTGAALGTNLTQYHVTIPRNMAGSIVVTAQAKDDPSQQVVVTINVVDYTLFYSEGTTTMGDGTVSAMETTDYSMTVNLTPPAGAATERYFTANKILSSSEWTLTGIPAIPANRLVKIAENSLENLQTYKVFFPENWTGTATLKAGVYTVSFNVQTREDSSVLNKGDTFTASGIEWRVMHKASASDMLIMSEHVLDSGAFGGAYYPWWSYPSTAFVRSKLNNSSYSSYTYNYYGLDSAFRSKILLSTLQTRHAYNGAAYDTTTDFIFLLSSGEIGSAAGNSVSNASQNIYPNVVFTEDLYARRATAVAGVSANDHYWLRDLYALDGMVAMVGMTGGGVGATEPDQTHGIRPAMRINLGPQAQVTSFSVSATNGGSTSYFTGATGNQTITVNKSGSPQTVTLTGDITGQFLSSAPLTWSGTTPAGWSFAPGTGVSGSSGAKTVAIPANGTGSFTVTVSATNDPAKKIDVTIRIREVNLSVSAAGAASFSNATTNQIITLNKSGASQTVTLTGNVTGSYLSAAPVTWSGTTRPADWTFSPGTSAGGGQKAVVIPANKTGALTVTVSATDDPTKKVDVTIRIREVTGVSITPASPGPFRKGTAITPVNFTATVTGHYLNNNAGDTTSITGDSDVTYSLSGSSGLSIDASTGVLSGMPTAAGSYTVTATSRDDTSKTATATFTVYEVTGVSITPNPVGPFYTGAAITSVDFTATVTGSYLISGTGSATSKGEDAVTWSISPTNSGLSFNTATGLLSGMPNKLGTYTVTATAKDDTSKTATVTFAVQVPPWEGVTEGETFYVNGIGWRVLTVDAATGAKLIITENYIAQAAYNFPGTNNIWVPYVNSTLKTTMDTWWAANGGALKAIARYPDNLGVESGYPTGREFWIGWAGAAIQSDALSGPGGSAAGADTGVVFPLSVSEVNKYRANFYNGNPGTPYGALMYWWLRSPGEDADYAAHVEPNGSIQRYTVTTGWYFRPALWISGGSSNRLSSASVPGEAGQGVALTQAEPEYIFPAVTGFRVSASGAGSQSFSVATDDRTISLLKSGSERSITLTGSVDGVDLPDNPALTRWSKTGTGSAWGPEDGNSISYTVTIPAHATGTILVTAKAKDDPSKTLTVTVEVTDIAETAASSHGGEAAAIFAAGCLTAVGSLELRRRRRRLR